jgi:hypothetical protein
LKIVPFAAVWVLAASSPAFCQQPDPTFNGLLDDVHCNLTTIVLCGDGACTEINSIPGISSGQNFWISVKQKVVSSFKYQERTPLGEPQPIKFDLKEVSPAAFNSPLYLKFSFVGSDALEKQGLLLLVPRGGGGYSMTFGETILKTIPIGGLQFNREIVSGPCEPM